MADKDVSKQIAEIKEKISVEEATRDQWASLLPDAEKGEGPQYQGLAEEISATISAQDATIESLKRELAGLEEQVPKKPQVVPKFDPEKHPLLKKATEKVEPAKPVQFNAGDLCEAQWKDKLWYKAKVQTVLGSLSNPKYHIRFVEYDETSTVDRDSIRPLPEKKRKAEVAPTPAAPSPTTTPYVISGPASINPEALAARQTPPQEAAAPAKRRTIGGHKALERKANDWKAFTSKGVGKHITKKDSMFRSGTTVNSRVGFTGSGAGMTQTNKRVRYNNNNKDQLDEEEG